MSRSRSLTSAKVKSLAVTLGAHLCGIAPSSRFSEAPIGFKPTDIYPSCKSVIVFACRLPPHILDIANRVIYTHASEATFIEVDQIGLKLSTGLLDHGVKSIPIPCDAPYEHWEPERSHGRGIISMRHAGQLAGLGVIGNNTLLVNEKYGNMICIGAVLVDAELEPDEVLADKYCPPKCNLCIESCPQKALDGTTVDQHLCRQLSQITTEKGFHLMSCNVCRKVCPNRAGVKRITRKRDQ
jgi:epoxyqueuosine reductase QueG